MLEKKKKKQTKGVCFVVVDDQPRDFSFFWKSQPDFVTTLFLVISRCPVLLLLRGSLLCDVNADGKSRLILLA